MLCIFFNENIHMFIYTVDLFGVHPVLLLCNIIFHIYHNLLLQSHVDWHLDDMKLSAITSNTDLNNFIHVLSYVSERVSLGIYQQYNCHIIGCEHTRLGKITSE